MDPSITKQKLKPGTVRRIVAYARPYRAHLAVFLLATCVDAVITVVNPLLLRQIIDHGILARDDQVVILIAAAVAAVAVFDALLSFVIRWFSARIGEGLIYDLRTQVFDHVQRQPVAFTRAQTGSLVSRLDGDVVGAQQAITSTLSGVVSNLLSLVVILVTLFYLSWLVSVIALAMIPLFILPARLVGRRMQRLTRESMQLNAEMGSTMTERFNVAGAMLVKLFGRPTEESRLFAGWAARVRDIGVRVAMFGQVLFVMLTLFAALATAVVFGLGGTLVIHNAFHLGTLVALSALLLRVYAPIGQLSNVQVQVMTALVSFDRVFEVLDLKPLLTEKPGAAALPRTTGDSAAAPDIEFDRVSFRYPPNARTRPRACCTRSASGSRRAASPRWSGGPGPARPRPLTWSGGCTTRTPARSGSPVTTCAMSRWRRCTRWWGSSPRTRTCSTTPSAPTCCTRGRRRPRPSWSRRARRRRSGA